MSKIIKIGMGAFVAALLLVGGAAYYVSTQTNPEEIKKLIIRGVTDAMPATVVGLEKVEYDLGLSVMVYLQNFELRLKEGKTPLFQVDKVELKIPIWAILTGGGAIHAQISNPNAFYLGLGPELTNWQKALPKADGSAEKKKTSDAEGEFKIPKIVENSRIDIKVSDLNVEYQPWQKEVSKFNVSKILLKNINLKSSTAYEIKSSVNYAISAEKHLQTNLQMIGEINIGKFLKDKSLSTAVVMTLTDTTLTGLDISVPNLENKLKVNILSDGTIETESDLMASNLAEAEVSATLANKTLTVNKFKLNLQLARLESVIPAEQRKSLQKIDFADSELEVTGDASVTLEPLALSPNFTIDMNKPVVVKVGDDLSAATVVKGTMKGKQVNFKVVSDLFDGSVTSTVTTEVDPLNLPAELENYPLTKVSVVATNIKFTRNYLQEALYGGKKAAKEGDAAPKDEVPGTKVTFPPVDLELEGKNIFVDQEEMEFTSLMQVRKNRIASDKFQILYSKGKTDIKFATVLVDNKNIDNTFDIKLKSMSLAGLNSLLPPYISQISGTYEGDLRGNLKLQPAGMKYDVKAKLTALSGDLKDLDVKQLVANFFENYKDKVPKEYEKISNKFDKMVVDAHATNSQVELKKFVMVGDKKSMELVLDGRVSMHDEYSKLTGTVMLPEYSTQIKREFGIEKLPVQFDGQGFVLKPNLTYTTEKLVGHKFKMVTSQAKKDLQIKANAEKERLQKEAAKEAEKLKKQLEEKGKDLLKGIKL